MKVDDLKIKELKRTAHERALDEGYTIATIGIEVEDLKLFTFENGEIDYIIADNLDNAIGFYIGMVGEEETKECEIIEIKDWHNLRSREEDNNELFENTTFLQSIKKQCFNGYSNPIYIASTHTG